MRLRIDTRSLTGSVDVTSLSQEELAARPSHPDLGARHDVPTDTRLWAALQNASGGSWGGCFYDVDRICALLRQGLASERSSP